MTFQDAYVSRELRYSLGVQTVSGRFYLSIPVSNGLVDYEEYYELSDAQYRTFLADPGSAARFAESCREHDRDELLIQKPGSNRGTPV